MTLRRSSDDPLPTDALQPDGSGLRLEIYAAPRAHKSKIVGLHDGRLKVQVAAPPVDGSANAELVAFIAGTLGLPKQQVTLVRGASSKRKTLRLEGIPLDRARGSLGLD